MNNFFPPLKKKDDFHKFELKDLSYTIFQEKEMKD
jgi:hypothetical protein